jgi:hypothetical protein
MRYESIIQEKKLAGVFDVFLCHNAEDKSLVKEIGTILIKNGILPWLDEWNLRPGLSWQDALEEQIGQIKSAAVFVGKNGVGPWQRRELNAFLREFAERGCPVIPVLLGDASQKPSLPIFLKDMTWVDFRKNDPDPIGQLIWGITGERFIEKHGQLNITLADLVTLRDVTSKHQLIEHVSDLETVRISNYPSAVAITYIGKSVNKAGHISLIGGEEVILKFTEGIHAIGLTYHQGINYSSIILSLIDGSTYNYIGKEFRPNINFFGFYSPQSINSLHIRTEPKGGSFSMRSFYFYSRQVHPRRFNTES